MHRLAQAITPEQAVGNRPPNQADPERVADARRRSGSGAIPSPVLAMGRHPAPVPGMTAVRRNPAVRAATSAFPRFRQLHPQQQTRRSGGLEGST